MPGFLSFRRMRACEGPFRTKLRLKLLSVHWSEGGFSQAACIDGLDIRKQVREKGKTQKAG